MNGIFQIPEFKQATLIHFLNELKKKGLDASIKWLRNSKELGTNFKAMPEKANMIRYYIGNRMFIGIYKKNGNCQDSLLKPEEKSKVAEVLNQMQWVQKPDLTAAICCSVLHFAVLLLFVAAKWNDSERVLAISLCTASIALISIGYMLWLPRVRQGQGRGKLIMPLILIGIFITVPTSLLQLVLIKALQKQTLYNAIGELTKRTPMA